MRDKAIAWEKEEDDILIQSKINKGLSYAKISSLLKNRTRNAVRHRWESIREKIDVSGVLLENKDRVGGPKVLIFDIETTPLIVYTWGVYQQFIRPEDIINDWYVLSWSAKWLHNKDIMSEVLTPKESIAENDKRIVSKLWELFDDADIIIGHNCDRFDQKKMNWRFLIHGFPPPLMYKTVDTLKVARKYFSSTSNKLDYLTGSLGMRGKTSTGGMELWKNCMKGDKDALDKMLNYNINDVVILENLYLRLLPWITNHPNLGLFDDREISVCPTCGSDKIKVEDKISSTSVNGYRQYRCENCFHVGRTKIHITTKEKRAVMLSN